MSIEPMTQGSTLLGWRVTCDSEMVGGGPCTFRVDVGLGDPVTIDHLTEEITHQGWLVAHGDPAGPKFRCPNHVSAALHEPASTHIVDRAPWPTHLSLHHPEEPVTEPTPSTDLPERLRAHGMHDELASERELRLEAADYIEAWELRTQQAIIAALEAADAYRVREDPPRPKPSAPPDPPPVIPETSRAGYRPEPSICPCGAPAVAVTSLAITSMPSYSVFDETGRSHTHDPNHADGGSGVAYQCSAGHLFERFGPRCWCGWPTEGERGVRIIGEKP